MKKSKIIVVGREEETDLMLRCMKSKSSELIAVYGRRRIGKTFLIRAVYSEYLCFELTGIYKATLRTQLKNFTASLTTARKSKTQIEKPQDWFEAFQQLKNYIERIKGANKKVIFFDELPWLDTKRSKFLQAFEHFWNSWATKRNDLIVVVCGSAASWIIKKIVNSKGGLHNRITQKIRLLPFSLKETEIYLTSNQVTLDKYQIIQLYMVMGGIPHYLKEVRPGESAAQTIDRVCFSKDGLLFSEFNNLYPALYDESENHIGIIKTLANKRIGLTRNQLVQVSEFNSGGTLTSILQELSESGFITAYVPLDKKSKDSVYRLTDEYSLFYIKFISNSRSSGIGTWIKKSTSQSWKSWSGYSFENVCLKHVYQIKKALGISGIFSEESSWRYNDGDIGTQIDLLIDRRDQCMNICEMKFSENIFEINKMYAAELDKKMKNLRTISKTRKTIFITMITTFGIKDNMYKNSLVSNSIQMERLFK